MTGPVRGGTVITVNGTNLGTVVGHLIGGVTVAGVRCEVRLQHFVPSLRFVFKVIQFRFDFMRCYDIVKFTFR